MAGKPDQIRYLGILRLVTGSLNMVFASGGLILGVLFGLVLVVPVAERAGRGAPLIGWVILGIYLVALLGLAYSGLVGALVFRSGLGLIRDPVPTRALHGVRTVAILELTLIPLALSGAFPSILAVGSGIWGLIMTRDERFKAYLASHEVAGGLG